VSVHILGSASDEIPVTNAEVTTAPITLGAHPMSRDARQHLRTRIIEGIKVVDFVDAGILYESDLIEAVGDQLFGLVEEQKSTKLVLNFSDVQFLSSMMLGKLADLNKKVRQAGGRLRLCGLGPILMDTFRISRFDSLFDIYRNEEAAIEAFRSREGRDSSALGPGSHDAGDRP